MLLTEWKQTIGVQLWRKFNVMKNEDRSSHTDVPDGGPVVVNVSLIELKRYTEVIQNCVEPCRVTSWQFLFNKKSTKVDLTTLAISEPSFSNNFWFPLRVRAR